MSGNPTAGAEAEFVLRLFITGQSVNGRRAIENLTRICEDELGGRYEVEVINVLENPRLAEHEKILATPTLIKKLPEPMRRVIGDLSDKEKVLLGLDIVSRDDTARGT